MPSSLRIAIVGGGIGGLTAALALRARGLDVAVFEQAAFLREIGAGVSIHPNAARLLRRVGLEDQLQKIGSPISGIALRTSQGEPIATPAGPATPAFSRGDQGYNVHRSDFLNLLFDALPRGTVTLGHRCIQLKEEADRVRLSFANGASAEADLVIGANGIRSAVQREIGLQSRPSSEGIMAYRELIPADRLSSLHLGLVHQAVEPGFRLGSCEHFSRRRSRRNLLRDRHPVRGMADRSMGHPARSASDYCACGCEHRAHCPDAKFDRRVHAVLCDRGSIGIRPRAARLREVRCCLVRRQARPGVGRNDERDRPGSSVGPAICPVAHRQLWLAHGLCRTWPAYLDDRVSSRVSVH
jgi:hypothetical protein